MSLIYFAYGSNMLPRRLTMRCPSARVVGPAIVAGHDLQFSKVSKDGSGKATLVRAAAETPGALFEIAEADLGALDRAEGRGLGYDRIDQFEVEIIGTGRRVRATTYLATAINRQLKPYDWYLAVVIAGAKYHELGGDYLARLQEFQHEIDPNEKRESRLGALAALQAEGFSDYRTLL